MGTEEDRFQGRTRDHTWLGLSSRSPFEVPRSRVAKRRTKQKNHAFYGLSWPRVVCCCTSQLKCMARTAKKRAEKHSDAIRIAEMVCEQRLKTDKIETRFKCTEFT